MLKKEGDKWILYSKDGSKVLGRFDSKKAALDREREINYFKHKKEGTLMKLMEDFYDAFRLQFPSQSEAAVSSDGHYIVDVLETHAIVSGPKNTYFKVPYTWENNKPKFADRETWEGVTRKEVYIPISEQLEVLEATSKGQAGDGKEWEVVIIGPDGPDGLVEMQGITFVRSKNGRLYSSDALKSSAELWEGIKVFDNHLTDEEFKAKQGMRSVANEWIGVITGTHWDAATNSVKGTLKVIDSNLREKLKNAHEAGVLHTIGLSIDALGVGRAVKTATGAVMQVVEKITKAMSVDVVSDPAAGGRLARMLAAETLITTDLQEVEMEELLKRLKELLKERFDALKESLEAMNEAQLKALVESLTPAAPVVEPEPVAAPETTPVVNDVSAEVTALVDKAEKMLKEAEIAREEAQRERELLSCGNLLVEKLSKSGLTVEFRSLIADQFKGKVFKADELDAAITRFSEAQGSLSKSGDIIIPTSSRLSMGLDPEEQFEMGFLKMVASKEEFEAVTGGNTDVESTRTIEAWTKAGKPAIAQADGLANWYVQYCGNYNAALDGRSDRLLEANLTTASLTSIIKNTVNLLLANDYSIRERWWEPIVKNVDVATPDDTTLVRLFGVDNLPVVSEGATYTEKDWADEEETASYVKRGYFIGVTLETLLHDKLNVIRSLPQRMSDAWYNTVSALVSGVFTVNSATGPVLGTSGALFNATAATSTGGHANLLTTELGYASLLAVYTAMRKQTDQTLGTGRRLLIAPAQVLIPTDLEAVAIELLSSELAPRQTLGSGTYGQTANIFNNRERFNYIVVPDWTDTNNWAAVADPSVAPAIHLIWLRGRRTPELFSATQESAAAMFTNDTLRYKVRQFLFRFSSTYDCAPVSDFRGVHKSNVSGG